MSIETIPNCFPIQSNSLLKLAPLQTFNFAFFFELLCSLNVDIYHVLMKHWKDQKVTCYARIFARV